MTRLTNQRINGRPATLAFLTDDFNPTTPERADLVKVLFDDEAGGSMFLPGATMARRNPDGTQKEQSE